MASTFVLLHHTSYLLDAATESLVGYGSLLSVDKKLLPCTNKTCACLRGPSWEDQAERTLLDWKRVVHRSNSALPSFLSICLPVAHGTVRVWGTAIQCAFPEEAAASSAVPVACFFLLLDRVLQWHLKMLREQFSLFLCGAHWNLDAATTCDFCQTGARLHGQKWP